MLVRGRKIQPRCTGFRGAFAGVMPVLDCVFVIFVGLAAPTQPSKLCPPACMGDINGDGSVGPADLAALLSNWGAVNPALPAADLNGDTIVNSQDLAILLSAWGPCLK